MRFIFLSLVFLLNIAKAMPDICLPEGQADLNIKSKFYLKEQTVYVKIFNNDKKNITITGVGFVDDFSSFAIRFRDRHNRIIKFPNEFRDGFISSSYFSSKIYLDYELPIVTLAPKQHTELKTNIYKIIGHLSKTQLRLITRPEIEWQFSVFFSDNISKKQYYCYSGWYKFSKIDF